MGFVGVRQVLFERYTYNNLTTFITAVQHERAPRCHQFRMQGPDISRFADERPSPYPVGDLLDRTR